MASVSSLSYASTQSEYNQELKVLAEELGLLGKLIPGADDKEFSLGNSESFSFESQTATSKVVSAAAITNSTYYITDEKGSPFSAQITYPQTPVEYSTGQSQAINRGDHSVTSKMADVFRPLKEDLERLKEAEEALRKQTEGIQFNPSPQLTSEETNPLSAEMKTLREMMAKLQAEQFGIEASSGDAAPPDPGMNFTPRLSVQPDLEPVKKPTPIVKPSELDANLSPAILVTLRDSRQSDGPGILVDMRQSMASFDFTQGLFSISPLPATSAWAHPDAESKLANSLGRFNHGSSKSMDGMDQGTGETSQGGDAGAFSSSSWFNFSPLKFLSSPDTLTWDQKGVALADTCSKLPVRMKPILDDSDFSSSKAAPTSRELQFSDEDSVRAEAGSVDETASISQQQGEEATAGPPSQADLMSVEEILISNQSRSPTGIFLLLGQRNEASSISLDISNKSCAMNGLAHGLGSDPSSHSGHMVGASKNEDKCTDEGPGHSTSPNDSGGANSHVDSLHLASSEPEGIKGLQEHHVHKITKHTSVHENAIKELTQMLVEQQSLLHVVRTKEREKEATMQVLQQAHQRLEVELKKANERAEVAEKELASLKASLSFSDIQKEYAETEAKRQEEEKRSINLSEELMALSRDVHELTEKVANQDILLEKEQSLRMLAEKTVDELTAGNLPQSDGAPHTPDESGKGSASVQEARRAAAQAEKEVAALQAKLDEVEEELVVTLEKLKGRPHLPSFPSKWWRMLQVLLLGIFLTFILAPGNLYGVPLPT